MLNPAHGMTLKEEAGEIARRRIVTMPASEFVPTPEPARPWPPAEGAGLVERLQAAEAHAQSHLDAFLMLKLGPFFQVVRELAAEVEQLRAAAQPAAQPAEELPSTGPEEAPAGRRFLSRWERERV